MYKKKYCDHEFSLGLSIVTLWFCNYNNFALFSDSACSCRKYHFSLSLSLSLSLSIIIATLSHFITLISIFSIYLCLFVSRKKLYHVFAFLFFFFFLFFVCDDDIFKLSYYWILYKLSFLVLKTICRAATSCT